MHPAAVSDAIAALLELPPAQQVAAARALIARLPAADPPEVWNTRFGPGSLFEAWTATSIARRVHREIVAELRPRVATPGWRLVEVGGGDGSIWADVLVDAAPGEVFVVDLVPEAIDQVRARVPASVTVHGHIGSIQDAPLPDCDGLICSMTLHHVAGWDASERAEHGLVGPGKKEILEAFGVALRPRDGMGLLVEADVDCDLDLASGSPELAEHIFDSYLRRCGRAILADIADPSAPAAFKDRWHGLLRHWFLEQLSVAEVPVAQRDVYELTVPRWTQLIADAGLCLDAHRNVDDWALFQLYRFQSGPLGA